MESFRLLTIGLPNLLNELVSNAFSETGVLTTVERYENLQHFIGDNRDADDCVIFIESISVNDCMEILRSRRKIHLVCVEDSGKNFNLWEMVPQKQVLGELSLDELVDKILEK